MFKTIELELELLNRSLNEVFSVSNNDLNSIRLNCTIKENANRFDLSGKIIRLAVNKSDGTFVFQTDGVTDGIDGMCEVILSREAYLIPGRHEAELMAYEGDATVAVTTKFYYWVNEAILSDMKLKSTNELPAAHQAIVGRVPLKDVDIDTLVESSTRAFDAAENVNSMADFAQIQGDYVKREAENAILRITELEGVDAVQFNSKKNKIRLPNGCRILR
ncbi:BppU family phage baseplate upper protein [Peribacillus butanolivorans]